MALLCRKFWNYCYQTSLPKARGKICRHYERKTGFLHGQIESKMPQNRGISTAHTCTITTGSVPTPTPPPGECQSVYCSRTTIRVIVHAIGVEGQRLVGSIYRHRDWAILGNGYFQILGTPRCHVDVILDEDPGCGVCLATLHILRQYIGTKI